MPGTAWPIAKNAGEKVTLTDYNLVVNTLNTWPAPPAPPVNANANGITNLGWVTFYNGGSSGGVNGLLQVRGTTNANDMVQQWGLGGGSGGYVALQLVKTTDVGGDFSFRTYSAGGGTSPKIKFGSLVVPDRFIMDVATGYFGIGTATPTFHSHIAGLGQDTLGSISNADGRRGGMLYVQDTGGSLYNGGAVVFGSPYGFWAGIKASIQDGGGNTTGVLSFLTRRSSADDAMSETMRLFPSGDVSFATRLNIGSIGIGTGHVLGPNGEVNLAGIPAYANQAAAVAAGLTGGRIYHTDGTLKIVY